MRDGSASTSRNRQKKIAGWINLDCGRDAFRRLQTPLASGTKPDRFERFTHFKPPALPGVYDACRACSMTGKVRVLPPT